MEEFYELESAAICHHHCRRKKYHQSGSEALYLTAIPFLKHSGSGKGNRSPSF